MADDRDYVRRASRHDNTGQPFNGHVFIDGGLWPSWEAYARYVSRNGTYESNTGITED